MAKMSNAGGLDGWARNEAKALSLSWFGRLAPVLPQIEATGQWPEDLLNACSTPLGQRHLCVLPVVYRLWASVRVARIQKWFHSWVPDSVFQCGQRGVLGGCLVLHHY